jgi:hypothetical protein
VSADFCAFCFGPLGEKVVDVGGRRYHPGHDKADRKLPQSLTTAEGVRVGGHGAAGAVQLRRQGNGATR